MLWILLSLTFLPPVRPFFTVFDSLFSSSHHESSPWVLSRVWLFMIPRIVARRAPLSMEFSKQECWSGLPFPPPGDLPNPGNLHLLHRQLGSSLLWHLGSHLKVGIWNLLHLFPPQGLCSSSPLCPESSSSLHWGPFPEVSSSEMSSLTLLFK